MMKILILNGPNLNLIGKREPEIYGSVSFETYLEHLKSQFSQHQIVYYQSNHEGCLIDKLQEADGNYDAVVMNPGGYAHTSIALADCIRAIRLARLLRHLYKPAGRQPCSGFSYIVRRRTYFFAVPDAGAGGNLRLFKVFLLRVILRKDFTDAAVHFLKNRLVHQGNMPRFSTAADFP